MHPASLRHQVTDSHTSQSNGLHSGNYVPQQMPRGSLSRFQCKLLACLSDFQQQWMSYYLGDCVTKKKRMKYANVRFLTINIRCCKPTYPMDSVLPFSQDCVDNSLICSPAPVTSNYFKGLSTGSVQQLPRDQTKGKVWRSSSVRAKSHLVIHSVTVSQTSLAYPC